MPHNLRDVEELLLRYVGDLEKHGIVRRRSGIFKGGFGDAVELTRDGYKSAAR